MLLLSLFFTTFTSYTFSRLTFLLFFSLLLLFLFLVVVVVVDCFGFIIAAHFVRVYETLLFDGLKILCKPSGVFFVA